MRAEVRAWLEATWNPDLGLIEWREKLIDAGWGAPTWPKALATAASWSRRWPSSSTAEIRRRSMPSASPASGVRNLAAQTLLTHGSDAQKEASSCAGALTGQDSWCQLFSEPGSGSDLAGAMTCAPS